MVAGVVKGLIGPGVAAPEGGAVRLAGSKAAEEEREVWGGLTGEVVGNEAACGAFLRFFAVVAPPGSQGSHGGVH